MNRLREWWRHRRWRKRTRWSISPEVAERLGPVNVCDVSADEWRGVILSSTDNVRFLPTAGEWSVVNDHEG